VLAEEKLLNELKLMKMQESGGKPQPEGIEGMVLSDDDYARLILQTYIETFGEDPKTLLESPPRESAAGEGKASAETQPGVQSQEKARGAGERVVNAGQGLLDNVQGLLGLRSRTSIESRAVVRDLGKSSGSLDALVERAKQRLIENMVIEEIELRLLAQERANGVKGYLIDHGGISNERIYLLDAELGTVSDGTALRVDLALSG
jgi:hypothetical protein